MKAFKSKVLHVALFALLAFVPLVLSFDPLTLYVMIGSVLVVMSFTIVHAYWPALKVALNQQIRELEYVDYLTLGIILAFLFTGLREAYITFYREFYLTKIPYRPNDYYIMLIFTKYGIIVGAFLALAARNQARVPGWPRAIYAIVIGVAIAYIFLKFT